MENNNNHKTLLEQSKSGIDFYKTFTGFASASILLVINFISKNDVFKISEIPICAQILIIFSVLSFFACIVIGIIAIRKVINEYGESFKMTTYTNGMLYTFSAGYGFLCTVVIIVLILINNLEKCN